MHAYPADFMESTRPPVVPDEFTHLTPQQAMIKDACSVNQTNSKLLRFSSNHTRTCSAAEHYWEAIRPHVVPDELAHLNPQQAMSKDVYSTNRIFKKKKKSPIISLEYKCTRLCYGQTFPGPYSATFTKRTKNLHSCYGNFQNPFQDNFQTNPFKENSLLVIS